jgi:hypothetical protein
MTKPKATAVAADDFDRTGKLKNIGGSASDAFNKVLADAALQTLWLNNSNPEETNQQLSAMLAALIGIAPQDEIEGMLASQMVAANAAAMECYRRAMLGEQTFEGRKENLTQANKLSRTYVTLLEALNRHRGKGVQQKVTVEHVHVHAGGQAVVGMVGRPGGGDHAQTEDQPHARQIAHAPEPALPSPDQKREPVPVAGDAERTMQDAWRPVTGSTQR